MKILFIFIFVSTTSSLFALNWPKPYPEDMPICPESSEELLEITQFLPSAHSESSRGICYVKAKVYSWWDLIGSPDNSYEVVVNAGVCNSRYFTSLNNKRHIKATVSYNLKFSKCESNPGCHYECEPLVDLWSL